MITTKTEERIAESGESSIAGDRVFPPLPSSLFSLPETDTMDREECVVRTDRLQLSEVSAPRFNPVATDPGAGMDQGRRLVTEESSVRVSVPTECPAPIPANHVHGLNVRPLRDISADKAEAERRLMQIRTWRALLDEGMPATDAIAHTHTSRPSICRWEKAIGKLDIWDEKSLPEILERLAHPLADPDAVRPQGRQGEWEPLLNIPEVCAVLYEIYDATLGASSAAMTNDRRTGNMAATLRAFAGLPLCPAALKSKLLAGNFPVCLIRHLGKITPEIEARRRGPKHFQLNGPSGRRDKVIGTPDGRRHYLPAGFVVELDDMSVNHPFWAEGPDGQPILSRQGLYARCLKGGWRAVELIARPRESYTSADILRFIRRFCQLYGKPHTFRIERSVWAARNISGFRLNDGEWAEEEVRRDAMGMEQRSDLEKGLRAIGIEIEYCHSARGKSDLEGAFHPLQTAQAINARLMGPYPNIGRHAGEFEAAAKKMRQVRAGSHHPRDLGFPSMNQLMAVILKSFDEDNARPRKNGSFDEIWARDTAARPLPALTTGDLAAFLPTVRERTITGCAVYPKADGREFGFRNDETFTALGDGYKVHVRFDPTEPSLGAAIYNREGLNSKNHQGYADGAFICFAYQDVPGCTKYVDKVPDSLPGWSVEDEYGRGAVANKGAGVKRQRGLVNNFSRTTFGARKPNEKAAQTAEARTEHGVTKAATGTQLAEPTLPVPPKRESLVSPSTPEEFKKTSARLSRQGANARALIRDE